MSNVIAADAAVTVAQALRRVKKLKGQIAEHTQHITEGVSYVSTKVPAFRFESEMSALAAARDEMINLEARVAVANANTTVKDGNGRTVTLAHAIRQLQELKSEIALLKSLNLRNEVVREREQEWDDTECKTLTRINEVTHVSDLSETDRSTRVKQLQNRFEALNNTVEDANHTTTV
jgi:hypothetical protein